MKRYAPISKKSKESGDPEPVVQQKATAKSFQPPDTGINFTIQKKENKTGLPDKLKSGVENLSGVDISDVKVHYNSSQPAQLNAHAYAQGNQIHVAPGQEKHLAHEAWHVVQQKQGRVKPTKQLKSAVPVNDNPQLEKEADMMGIKALQLKSDNNITELKSVFNFGKGTAQLARDVDEVASAIGGDGKMEGFGAMVGAKKWLTKITWGALNGNAQEGSSMLANPLGPEHPSGQSSTSSDEQSKARAQFLTGITGTPYIQGHLLNDNLGGPAARKNLTAIPGKPGNSAHNTAVEEPVKAQMDLGRWIYYSVQVNYVTKKIKEINPDMSEEFFSNTIKKKNYYNNLPGVKPANLNANFTIASNFTTEWYTFQANGSRHSAISRHIIKFPVVLNNADVSYVNIDDTYNNDYVEIGATTVAEQTANGAAATATAASWLHLNKDLDDKKSSAAPNVEKDDYTAIALREWKDEIEDCVNEDTDMLKYPDTFAHALTWKTVKVKTHRVRKGRYADYIKQLDKDIGTTDLKVGTNWQRYKDVLINQVKARYEAEWANVRDSADQTLQ